MEEVFEIIKGFNRLKERVIELIAKIDLLLKSQVTECRDARSRLYPDDYVEEEGACRILHICPRTLAKLRAEGSIPYIKKGKRIQYLVGDLRAYLEHIKIRQSS
jgi:hypothetical protein